jgi:hypothetical protein
LLRRVNLRAAGHSDAHGSRRNKFEGERQRRICRVFVVRKFVGGDRLDDGQHVVERLAGEILRALVGDFSTGGGRIEPGQVVRQKIGVREIAEIAADVHRIIQQGQLRAAGENGCSGQENKRPGGQFF